MPLLKTRSAQTRYDVMWNFTPIIFCSTLRIFYVKMATSEEGGVVCISLVGKWPYLYQIYKVLYFYITVCTHGICTRLVCAASTSVLGVLADWCVLLLQAHQSNIIIIHNHSVISRSIVWYLSRAHTSRRLWFEVLRQEGEGGGGEHVWIAIAMNLQIFFAKIVNFATNNFYIFAPSLTKSWQRA